MSYNYFAQNVPATQNSKELPIQRTIEEENSQGLTPSQITTQAQSDSTSQKQVTFGLATVLLVIVAIVAVAVYWRNFKS